MQPLATELARNCFQYSLPVRGCNVPARTASFYRGFALFRPLHSEGVGGGDALIRHHARLLRAKPNLIPHTRYHRALTSSGRTRLMDLPPHPHQSTSAIERWASCAQ